jgi:plasmid replication initiation protein
MEQMELFKIDSDLVKPNEYSVTKANTLIEANYRLTLTQQRIAMLMASMVQPSDEDFKTYRIHVKDLMDVLDINRSHLYEQMIVMIRNLMKIVVTINMPDGKYLDTHWIQDQEYEVGGGYADVTFSPKLKPFLLHLKDRFTTYKLENVIRLKSVYSIRIYELLKQYQGIGRRTITIENLRKMLGITPKEYRLYGHFKDKVILVAHREINEKTDILFEFKEIKLSRKVNELEFTITKKAAPGQPDKPRNASAPPFVKDKAAAKLKKKIDAYIEKLSPDELERLRKEATEKHQAEGGSFIKNPEIREQAINGCMLELARARMHQKKK